MKKKIIIGSAVATLLLIKLCLHLHNIHSRIMHSLILSREGLILTLSILPCPEGWISWSIPVDELMRRRMSIVHAPPKLGRYWEIHPLRPWDFPRPSRVPSGFALGKSLGSREISGRQGWISQDFPSFGGAWIQLQCWLLIVGAWLYLLPSLSSPPKKQSSAQHSWTAPTSSAVSNTLPINVPYQFINALYSTSCWRCYAA